jgi:hypothetical protein
MKWMPFAVGEIRLAATLTVGWFAVSIHFQTLPLQTLKLTQLPGRGTSSPGRDNVFGSIGYLEILRRRGCDSGRGLRVHWTHNSELQKLDQRRVNHCKGIVNSCVLLGSCSTKRNRMH